MRPSMPAWQQALLSLATSSGQQQQHAAVSAVTIAAGATTASNRVPRSARRASSNGNANEQLDRRRTLASIALLASYSWYMSVQRAVVEDAKKANQAATSRTNLMTTKLSISAASQDAALFSPRSLSQRRGRRRSISNPRGPPVRMSNTRSMSSSSAQHEQHGEASSKAQQESVSGSSDSFDGAPPESVKRRRGRPAKNKQAQDSTPQATAESSTTTQSQGAATQSHSPADGIIAEDNVAAEPDKQKTRRTKAEVAKLQRSDEPEDSKAIAERQNTDVKPRRGRPRKKPMVEAPVQVVDSTFDPSSQRGETGNVKACVEGTQSLSAAEGSLVEDDTSQQASSPTQVDSDALAPALSREPHARAREQEGHAQDEAEAAQDWQEFAKSGRQEHWSESKLTANRQGRNDLVSAVHAIPMGKTVDGRGNSQLGRNGDDDSNLFSDEVLDPADENELDEAEEEHVRDHELSQMWKGQRDGPPSETHDGLKPNVGRKPGSPRTYAEKVLVDEARSGRLFSKWKSAVQRSGKSNSLRVATELANKVRSYRVPKAYSTRELITRYRQSTSKMLNSVLDDVRSASTFKTQSRDRLRYHCLRVQAAALLGELRTASDMFIDMRKEFGQVFTEIPRTASEWLQENSKGSKSPFSCVSAALESILLATSFSIPHSQNRQEETNEAARELLWWMLDFPENFAFVSFVNPLVQRPFNMLLRSHDDILAALQGYVKARGCRPSDVQQGTESVILALIAADNLFAVLKVERWCRKHGVRLREVIKRRMLRYYSFNGEAIHSETMARELDKTSDRRPLERETCRTLVMHHAKSSDTNAFEDAVQRLLQLYPEEARASAPSFLDDARLTFFSSAGNPEQTLSLLSKEYDMSEATRNEPIGNLKRPDDRAFTYLIRAHLSAGRIEDAQRLIAQQTKLGMKPNVIVLNALMDAFAERGDIPAALSLFRSMETDKSTNTITYTGLLKLFSRSKDVLSATNVVAAMRARSVRIDRKVMGLLLNAHVEAGGWTGARHLFEYLENSRESWLRPGPSEYNTMLKAHVQRSLPVQQTYRFFNHMMQKGMSPSPVSYALILQAACDAGIMNLAEDLFTIIEDRLGGQQGLPPGKGANAWHFTIMINAYFRVERPEIARDYLDELNSRQLPVSAALKNIIIGASANEGAEDDLEVARELARSYVIEAPHQILEIYEPLLRAATKEGQTEMVQGLIDEITSRGIQVPNVIWTTLLDGLRRDDNIVAVMELWKKIFQQAVDAPTFDEPALSNVAGVKRVASSKRNVLCFPLSIVIDALARNERYEDVANIWIECRKHGFAFDSHNWNHMAVALLRAHRLDDGAAIIEYVLNSEPPSSEWNLRQIHTSDLREWMSSSVAPQDLNEILSTGLPPFQGETENLVGPDSEGRAQTPQKPPNRRHEGRLRDDLETRLPSALDVPGVGGFTPLRDPNIEIDESYDASEHSPAGDTAATENSKSMRRRNTAMRSLVARDFLDRMQSPWFAHFETMQTLSEILEDANRENGGFLDMASDSSGNSGATQSDASRLRVNDFLERYPRVRALLGAFDDKVAMLRERARLDAMRS